jgi:hypothetical protein
VDDQPFKQPIKVLAVLHFLLDQQKQGCTPVDQTEAAEAMIDWLAKADFIPLMHRPRNMDAEGIRHSLNDLRTTLKNKTAWGIPARALSAAPFTLHLRG